MRISKLGSANKFLRTITGDALAGWGRVDDIAVWI